MLCRAEGPWVGVFTEQQLQLPESEWLRPDRRGGRPQLPAVSGYIYRAR